MSNENILPNCLAKSGKIDRSGLCGAGNWFYLVCASCGANGGRIRDTELPLEFQFGFYLCGDRQNNCIEKYGALAGTSIMPDEVIWRKIHDAQIEKYGRILGPDEIAVELEDSSSMISKLAKEKAKCL